MLTAENDLALIDSNLLVYLADQTEQNKHRRARDFFNGVYQKPDHFAIAIQNIREFASVMSAKKQMMPQKLDEFINTFFGFENILFETQNDISKAISDCHQLNTPFWDSLLAATMHRHGITTIYTENVTDFKKLGLTVINPLK